jgi:hypothetical protein
LQFYWKKNSCQKKFNEIIIVENKIYVLIVTNLIFLIFNIKIYSKIYFDLNVSTIPHKKNLYIQIMLEIKKLNY